MANKEQFEIESSGLLPFDPIVLVQDVLRKWLLIAVLSLVAGMAAYVVTDASYVPEYQTGTTIVVTTRSSTGTVYSNLSATTTLASVFTEMVNSSVFRQTVLEEAGIAAFDGTITASAVSDTNLLTLRVSASDPRSAFLVIQAVLNNHQSLTDRVIGDVVLEVLQKPAVPMMPSNTNQALSYAKWAILLTAAASCVLFGYLSFIRDMVRSGSEARKKLNCWYLGEIPHERHYRTVRSFFIRQKKGILVNDPTTSFYFIETLQKIRHRVEQHLGDDKVLMVTSLLENEGKSTIAVNLALSMAEKKRKVLLIDCDLRKPACAKLMNVNWNQEGVRAVLGDGTDPMELIVHDNRNGLDILLERSGTQSSGALVSSVQMRRMLEQLRPQYDVIILDLPPMGTVSDAEAVMELADASLLVVRQNTASAPAINKALAALNRGSARLIGCVLNNVYSTDFFSGQGYGYGYGYGYGSYKRYGRYGRYGKYGKYGTYSRYAKKTEQNSERG